MRRLATDMDALALGLGRVYLVVLATFLYAGVVVTRRFGRYLKDIDDIEMRWMTTSMMAYARDIPRPIEERVRLLGYIGLFSLLFDLYRNILMPVILGVAGRGG